MIFFDTETVGFHGPIVLLQYAEGLHEPVKLYCPWQHPIRETLELIQRIVDDQDGVVGFNLSFDWFHLCQMYTTLVLMSDFDAILKDCMEEYALKEPDGRFGPCLKPKAACDLMLHARKGLYQSTMDRDDIRVRKVPTALAWQLADELESRVKIKDIYFVKKKVKTKKWQVFDIEDNKGRINPDFKDVVLKFYPSSALKALAGDALGLKADDVLLFADIELSRSAYPEECGYAPFALAVGKPGKWKGAWPEVIGRHIDHWTYHKLAREYAAKDVEYLQLLYPFFGSPAFGDIDSDLACMVGAVRWKGFKVNVEGLRKLQKETRKRKIKLLTDDQAKGMWLDRSKEHPEMYEFVIPTSPAASRRYIEQVLSETERLVFSDEDNLLIDNLESSTKRSVLEKMALLTVIHEACNGEGCKDCQSGKRLHPAAERAGEVLRARQADYESNFFGKLILAGRLHAAMEVIGALSGRMSGRGGDLNVQGVKRTKEIRREFPLADDSYALNAGDFSAFEVCLAEAVYNDPDLRKELQSFRDCRKCRNGAKTPKEGCKQCGGKGVESTKIHALFGESLFPHLDYYGILESEGTLEDYYDKSKRSFFATLYGGDGSTLNNRVGVPIEIANEAIYMFGKRFPRVAAYTAKIYDMFCSMRQPGGIGTKVEWHQPAEKATSLLGFSRYFTLENEVCKALFDLASDPPKQWRSIKIRVMRRDRVQSAFGAVQSALYASAFNLQSGAMRAAKNHEIQSTGAGITKALQHAIWSLQPHGIKRWLVQPLNIHDEIQCPTDPSMTKRVEEVVNATVESFRPKVPLIKMDWKSNLSTWADKS